MVATLIFQTTTPLLSLEIYTSSKIFKNLLICHVLKYLKSNSLLSAHQYGFYKERSSNELLLYLLIYCHPLLGYFGYLMLFLLLPVSLRLLVCLAKVCISRLTSYRFTLLYKHIFSILPISFLSIADCEISATSGVSSNIQHVSVLSLALKALFLVFINNFLKYQSALIIGFAEGSTLLCSSSFIFQPSSQLLFFLITQCLILLRMGSGEKFIIGHR